jgi:chromosome segregation ATPase
LEKALSAGGGAAASDEVKGRLRRLRGVLDWKIYTEYEERLTVAHKNLRALNHVIDVLHKQYTSFVRTRQAATQSYEGYGEAIRRLRSRITAAREKVEELKQRQGHVLEVMAVNELTRRRERLEEFQVKAHFAMADSYDRASKAQRKERDER